MKYVLFFFALILVVSNTEAQRKFHFMLGEYIGDATNPYSYSPGTHLHQATYYSKTRQHEYYSYYDLYPFMQITGGIRYDFSPWLSIETGVQWLHQEISLIDFWFQGKYGIVNKDLHQINFISQGTFAYRHAYFSNYFSALFSEPRTGLFLGIGAAYQTCMPGNRNIAGSYLYEPTQEWLQVQGTFSNSYWAPIFEVGFRGHDDWGGLMPIMLGLKWQPGPTVFKGSYTNSVQGALQYQEDFSHATNYFALELKLPLEKIGRGSRQRNSYFTSGRYRSVRKSKPLLPEGAQLIGTYLIDRQKLTSGWIYASNQRYYYEKADSAGRRTLISPLPLQIRSQQKGKWIYPYLVDLKNESRHLNIISVFEENNHVQTSLHTLSEAAHLIGNATPLAGVPVPDSWDLKAGWSGDSTKFGVVIHLRPDQKNKEHRLFVATFDREFRLLDSARVVLTPADPLSTSVDLTQMMISNQGEMYLLGTESGKNNTRHTSIWTYDPMQRQLDLINQEVDQVADSRLLMDNRQTCFLVGLYTTSITKKGKRSGTKLEGTFHGTIHRGLRRVTDINYQPVPDLPPTFRPQTDLIDFSACLKSNGQIYLIWEVSSILKSAVVAGNVMVVDLTAAGYLRYVIRLPKYQTASLLYGGIMKMGYLDSYKPDNQSLQIVYFNKKDMKAINRSERPHRWRKVPMVVTIDSLGQVTKTPAMTETQPGVKWIPSLSFELKPGKIMLVGRKQNRYVRKPIYTTIK